MNLDLISSIIGLLTGFGVLLVGAGFGFGQLKIGGSKAKDELIKDLKDAKALLEDKLAKLAEERTQLITSHQAQITELTKNLGVLQGRFDAQVKEVESYKLILQGRDPGQTEIMKEIRDYLKTLSDEKIKLV